MTRYAVMEDDTVVNIVLWDGTSELAGSEALLPCGDDPVALGWTRVDNEWVAPVVVEPEPTLEEQRESRRLAYMNESDGLRWKAVRGEDGITDQMWLDKVNEIRERFPYPDEEQGATP